MRVEAVDSARKRLTLGLVARKAAGGEDGEAAARDELGGLQPGDVVRGSVAKVQKKQVSCLRPDASRPQMLQIALWNMVQSAVRWKLTHSPVRCSMMWRQRLRVLPSS